MTLSELIDELSTLRDTAPYDSVLAALPIDDSMTQTPATGWNVVGVRDLGPISVRDPRHTVFIKLAD